MIADEIADKLHIELVSKIEGVNGAFACDRPWRCIIRNFYENRHSQEFLFEDDMWPLLKHLSKYDEVITEARPGTRHH